MSTEKITMQQQFEVWARSQCMQLKKDGVVTTYTYERTDLAWNAWMASRAAIEVVLPRGSVYPAGEAASEADYYFDQGQADGLRKARNAIESFGLKVKQ